MLTLLLVIRDIVTIENQSERGEPLMQVDFRAVTQVYEYRLGLSNCSEVL